MISFKQFMKQNTMLDESYKNLIGDDPRKAEYADQVWDILQKSYKSIGGIKGSGFEDKKSMITRIPFWKINVKNGKVVFVSMYKDKNGRKSVALGSDGSPEGKKTIDDFFGVDLKRSYGEKSKAALGKMLKIHGFEAIEPYLIDPTTASNLLRARTVPVSELAKDDIPQDGQMTLAKYPQLKKYAYTREINDQMMFKVMVGTVGKNIR